MVLKQSFVTVMDLFRCGIVKTVSPITTLPMSQISHGMRTLQGGKHMGKIVIEVMDDDIVQASQEYPLRSDRSLTLQQAIPTPSPNVITDKYASYLVTEGTGGLGRTITRWLARQGAKSIILASRSGMKQGGVYELLEELKHVDCAVTIKQCDVASHAQVQKMVDECRKDLPPIRGVIHGAMALRDALFDKISFEDWTVNIAPRVNGAWNLHNSLTSNNLEFFVMLASASGLTGLPGQTAYAASNTFLDAFAAYRQGLGLPACAIDIGIVEGVGYVAENIDRRAEIESAAHDRLTEQELLSLIILGIANCRSPNYQQILTGCKLLPDRPLPVWATDPKFSHVLHAVQSESSSTTQESGGSSHIKVS